MEALNGISTLDGNVYLVAGVNTESTGNADFDKIYNDITVDDSLEEIFSGAADKFGIDENFLKAVAKAESGFDTEAESYCGAQGIMQLMPFTSEAYGVTDPFDATQNIYAGAQLLSELLEKYNGNATLALAAYNAGSGSVAKYGGVPPYEETVNYIAKINDYLGGALSGDSTTIEGSTETDFSTASAVQAPDTDVSESNSTTVLSNSLNNISLNNISQENSSTSSDELISYEEYMYVMDTYRSMLEEIFSVVSGDENNTLSTELYNMAIGNSGRTESTETDNTYNTNSELTDESGVLYNKAEVNVNMLNGSTYESMYGNDPLSIYQAQASMISPIILKLLDL